MKTLKRIASVFLAAAFVLCTMMTSAFAASVHSYKSYQIFSGSVLKEGTGDNATRVLANIDWGEAIKSGDTDNTDALIEDLIADSKNENSDIKNAFKTLSDAIDAAKAKAEAEGKSADDVKASSVVSAADVAAACSAISSDEDACAKLALILYKHVIASAGKAVSNGGEVGNGYFLVVDVTDGDKNPNLLQVVNENIRITDKISTPTITKQVYESDFVLTAGGEEGDGYNDVATYKINDDVDYNLNITVPGQLHNYNHYEMVIHDVMDAGLDFKSDSVEVYINKTVTEKVPDDSNGAEEGATKEVTKTVSTKLAADSYVLGTSGDHRFKITFDDIRSLKDENDGAIDAADDYTTFTVKFKATLNQNATTGPANPNDNKVWLCYTNDPNATHDDSSTTYPGTPEDEDNPKDYPDSPDEEDKDNKNEDGTEKDDKDKNPESDDDLSHTPVDVVGVYTYGLTLIKVDGQSKTTKLAGATFTMSQGATEATATAMKFTKVTKTLVEATETEAAKTEDVYYYNPNGDVAELVTDANGQIKVIGLESGESGKYFLTETAAPAGYHKLDGAIELNLDTNVGQEFNSYENDNKDTDGGDVVEYVELKQGTKTVGEKNTTDGIMSITVDNTKGSPLPETGGMGTAIFYTVGGVLVIAAGIYLVMKKRNANA